MSWAIGSTYQNAFATVLDNVPTDADSTPTLTLYVGGVASGATVTVTDVGVGEYTVSVSLSGLSMGDVCQIKGSATIDSVSYPVHLEPFVIGLLPGGLVDVGLIQGGDAAEFLSDSLPTVSQIRQEIDANSTQLSAIQTRVNNIAAKGEPIRRTSEVLVDGQPVTKTFDETIDDVPTT